MNADKNQGEVILVERPGDTPGGASGMTLPAAGFSPSAFRRSSQCLNDPAGGRIDRLPENEVQLRGMVLDVAHVVQKQLRDADVHPFESAALASSLACQGCNR